MPSCHAILLSVADVSSLCFIVRVWRGFDITARSAGGTNSHRARLEIAQKLVDTLIQSSGGGGGSRRPSDHYSGAGEPPYKRTRDESYDRDRVSTGS